MFSTLFESSGYMLLDIVKTWEFITVLQGAKLAWPVGSTMYHVYFFLKYELGSWIPGMCSWGVDGFANKFAKPKRVACLYVWVPFIGPYL